MGNFYRRNPDIREARGKIPIWVIADRLNVHENTLRNWLKKEISGNKKMEILTAIEQIKKEWNLEIN